MIVTRVERHLIKKNEPIWKIIDQKCWEAKSLYNCANYIVREEFKSTGKWIRYIELDKIMQKTLQYKRLGSQASQNTLTLLDRNWKSFFNGIKDWSKKDGEGYFGKPEYPDFKKKDGRSILIIKNIQCRIEDSKLLFSWFPLKPFGGIQTKVTGKMQQVRFVPKGACYYMEIVYQTEIKEPIGFNNRIAGIDLGVNNFVTMGNNIGVKPIIIKGGTIKAMNQWYNKEIARIAKNTKMIWNNKMRGVTDKHLRKVDTYLHLASKRIVGYCLENKIDTLIVGLSKEWKDGSNIGHVNNQNFVYVSYENFINKLKYKCENIGIHFETVNEDYTSGTSFLDDEASTKENYNKKRRIKRGLFRSNNKTLINADLNAAYQIIKKVYPSAFAETVMSKQNGGSRGCDLHPVELHLN